MLSSGDKEDQGVSYWILEGVEAKFFFSLSPVVGGVAVGGRAVSVRLRRMHGHVVFQHSATTHVTVPVSTVGH